MKSNTVIKANRGDTTIATHFSFITAGSWQQRDFPEPVGIDTKTPPDPGKKDKNKYSSINVKISAFTIAVKMMKYL